MNFLKKYRLFIALLLLLIILLVLKIFIKTAPQSAENAWGNIIPGKTTTAQAVKELGKPLNEENIEGKTVYLYPSETQTWPTQVFLTENKKLVLGIKRFFPSKEETYQSYLQRFGSPDKQLFGPHSPAGFLTFIYLAQGMAVVANPESGIILEVWYFPPADLNTFLANWGKDLHDTLPQQF